VLDEEYAKRFLSLLLFGQEYKALPTWTMLTPIFDMKLNSGGLIVPCWNSQDAGGQLKVR
jgi:hypothetical protein